MNNKYQLLLIILLLPIANNATDLHKVRTEDALNLSYKPYQCSGYRIKWLYVPEQNDWVLITMSNNQKKITYIDKTNPDPQHPLPSGTFFWRSQNKNSFLIKLNTGRTEAYELLYQIKHARTVSADGRHPSASVRTVVEKQEYHPERLIRSDFVEDAQGISEEVWRLQLKNLYSINVAKGALVPVSHAVYGVDGSNVKSYPRAQSVFTGNGVSEISLATYRFTTTEYLQLQLDEHNRLLGNFSLIQSPQSQDIRHLQIQYPNAYFQIASNFNALEGGMGNRNTMIIGMAGKHAVQGEEAAVAVGGASIYRKYYREPINMLSNMGSLLRLGTGSSYQPIILGLQPGKTLTVKNGDNFKVCVHARIAVTSSDDDSLSSDGKPVFNHRESTAITNASKLISQVLVSAQDLNPKRNKHAATTEQRTIAKVIQKIIYEGTLLAAYLGGDTGTKVILTLVGAGSFANDTSWIADAIERMQDFIIVSGLDVRLVLRGGGSSFDARMNTLKETIQTQRTQLAHDPAAYDAKLKTVITWFKNLQ